MEALIDSGNGVTLRLVTEGDAAFIVSLRTDTRLNEFLSPVSPSVDAQRDWIRAYKAREHDRKEFYYIILFNTQPSGTIRMYDFRGDSFCWGSWIVLPGLPPWVSIRSVFRLLELGFDTLGFERTHFDVRKANRGPRRFYLGLGAKIVSEDEDNLYLELSRKDFESVRPRYARYAGGARE